VILAAVIAAFVFGMAGGISNTKNVAATAQQVGAGTIIVTYQGGQDAADVDIISVNVRDTGFVNMDATAVGTTYIDDTNATPGQDHVVVTVSFTDGSKQVVLDTYV